ncbi:SPOR domain-containing protein [Xinfangfangia sp. D13-10-4-6]|nr:SPOR domain-containing protein [Pseudogemmobacter hezensis]
MTRAQRMVNIAGAVGSVALVVSLAYWGWELAVRDVRGVPVVRAMEGPMRVAPSGPSGLVVSHQGLEVNDVAARDGGNRSDTVRLAPSATELTAEDVAGLSVAGPAAPELGAPEPGAPETALMGEAAADTAPVTRMSAAEESPAPLEVAPEALAPATTPDTAAPVISQDEAVALALAEALGMDDAASAELVAQASPALPAGAMATSPRPRARPGSLSVAAAGGAAAAPALAAGTAAEGAAAATQIDPASLQPGTRLVQFGAFESEADAVAEWSRIAAKLGPLMGGKAMVVQSAESSGHTFWRLRGHGFASEDDARRFCSAAVAEQINCIPVTQR